MIILDEKNSKKYMNHLLFMLFVIFLVFQNPNFYVHFFSEKRPVILAKNVIVWYFFLHIKTSRGKFEEKINYKGISSIPLQIKNQKITSKKSFENLGDFFKIFSEKYTSKKISSWPELLSPPVSESRREVWALGTEENKNPSHVR